MIYFLVNLVYSQTIPLDNFHIGPKDQLTIFLPDFISEGIGEFSLTGSYNESFESDSLKIYNTLESKAVFEKEYPSIESGFQVYYNTLYDKWEHGVVIYDITNPYNITNRLVLDYTNNTVISVSPTLSGFIISLETGGIFRVINETSGEEFIEMQFIEDINNIISCSYLAYLGYYWAFPYNSTQISAIRFDFSSNSAVLYRRYESSAFNNVLNIASFEIYNMIAYICDSLKGVLSFLIQDSLENTNIDPTLLEIFQHPLLFGQINNCIIANNRISVLTDTNAIVYSINNFNFIAIYQSNGPISCQHNFEFTIIQTSDNRIQVYLSTDTIKNQLIADKTITLDSLFLFAAPRSYILIYLLTSNSTTFEVFRVYNPTILFNPQDKNYEYNGIISINNNEMSFPIKVVASTTSGIFTFLGPYPEYGYSRPLWIGSYLNWGSFDLRVSLSYYFSGNNVSYSLYGSQGTTKVIEKIEFISSYEISFQYNNYSAVPNLLLLASSDSLSCL